VRVTPRAVRNDQGSVDVVASLAAGEELLAAGGTDLFVSLKGWCPDAGRAPAFLEARRAALMRSSRSLVS
jgi:hypothetical protein